MKMIILYVLMQGQPLAIADVVTVKECPTATELRFIEQNLTQKAAEKGIKAQYFTHCLPLNGRPFHI